MDARRPLTDEALDQALGALLNERPSAAFEARVRARVALETPGSAWRHRWPLAALSAAGLATAATLLVVLSPPHTPVSPAPPSGAESHAPLATAPASAQAPPSVSAPASVSGPASASAPVSASASASVSTAASVSAVIGAAPGGASRRPPAPARDRGELAVTASAPAAPPPASDFPEVLVSEDEVRTFQRLVALSQQETPRPEPSPAEITAGQRGTVRLPPLSFDPVVIDEPALAAITLE